MLNDLAVERQYCMHKKSPRIFVNAATQHQQWWANLEKSAIMREGAFAASREDQAVSPLEYIRVWLKFANPWEIMENRLKDILSRPACGAAIKLLLEDAERTRVRATEEDWLNDIEGEITGMVRLICQKARERLAVYRQAEAVERGMRPADIYRDFGLPLRYATESLGHIEAREVLRSLMLEVTLPFDELENPDWIDPYTGEDLHWEPVHVRAVSEEVSCAGNDDESLEMLDDLDAEDRASFQAMLSRLGWDVKRYLQESAKAQNGGYSEVVGSEPREFEVLFGGIEKDFEYKKDLQATEESEDLARLLDAEIRALRRLIYALAPQPKDFPDGKVPPRVLQAVRDWVRRSNEAKRLLKFLQANAQNYRPQDLMTVVLPFQNELCFTVEDLAVVRLPHYQNLARWFREYGGEYLNQFNDRPGQMGEYPEEYLDLYVRLTVEEQLRMYLSRKGEIAYRKALKGAKGKRQERLQQAWDAFWITWEQDPHKRYGPNRTLKRDDARFAPEFVEAELMAAVYGSGGTDSALAAGWSAWRMKRSREGDRAYREAKQKGASNKEAMVAFWGVVKAEKNRIVGINRFGLTLASGRKIDWGIALLKLKQNELGLSQEDRERLRSILSSKGWATQFCKEL